MCHVSLFCVFYSYIFHRTLPFLPPFFPARRSPDIMAFKDELRLFPPVPASQRRARRDFEFAGYNIPAGTNIGINPAYTHMMAEYWPEPERFDPMRFAPEAVRGRHKYAWVPFGGGAPMRLGLHFASIQAKIFFHTVLTRSASLRVGKEGFSK